MRKVSIFHLLSLLLISISGLVLFALLSSKSSMSNRVSLPVENEILSIKPWFNESDSKYYLFLPSFAHAEDYSNYSSDDCIVMQSENLPSVFIDTKSNSMEYINEDKQHEENGRILIVDSESHIDTLINIDSIHGRGNTSWTDYPKKPYSLELAESESILNMRSGTHWYLLPIWREGSYMTTKIAMQLANELGLANTPNMEWVDVYFNGEYAGLYLLSESLTVEEGRIELPDSRYSNNVTIENSSANTPAFSFLIEKDFEGYVKYEPYSFRTNDNNDFTLKYPKKVSDAEWLSVQAYMQKIEDAILSSSDDISGTTISNYIDLDSLASVFVINEFTLNIDSFVTSSFFIYNPNDGNLYAGPIWDYDSSFGNYDLHSAGFYCDYSSSILDNKRSGDFLTWVMYLKDNKEFMNIVKSKYESIGPFLRDTISANSIDKYHSLLRASAAMDCARWSSYSNDITNRGQYTTYEENVQYLKYFLTNRIEWMNQNYK